jgi:hypothetical protein
MAKPRIISPLRSLAALVTATVVVLGAVDAGSIALTKASVPDDVRRAGQVAASAVKGQPATRQTARLAFDAAQTEARKHGIVVSTEDFTLYPDGRVTLTAGKTAPTLLLHRVEMLSGYADVHSTVTVEPSPYS